MPSDQNETALRLYGREVKVTRYDHGGARFYVDDESGRGLVADTYSLVATDFVVEALRRAEEGCPECNAYGESFL